MTVKVKQIQILSSITANTILDADVQIVFLGVLVEQVGTWMLSIGQNCRGLGSPTFPPTLEIWKPYMM